MSESTDRVLIAGGGIAGLATAAALGRTASLLWSSKVATRRSTQAPGINLPGNAVMASLPSGWEMA